MDDLKMPDSFARPCVQADDALAEKIVAEPMPAVEVMRRGFHGQIDVAQFRVGAIIDQTPVFPVYFHEPFSQVSLPNSPACGIV